MVSNVYLKSVSTGPMANNSGEEEIQLWTELGLLTLQRSLNI